MGNLFCCGGGTIPPRPKSCVLVVEDDDRLRQILCEALTGAGYRVLSSASGRDALQLIEREAVDIVFTAIVMPDMDGFEVIRHLAETSPCLPVIAMSDPSASTANYLKFARLFGAAAILTKPFEPTVALELARRHAAPA